MSIFKRWRDLIRQRVENTLQGPFDDAVRLQLELRPYLQGVPYWTAAGLVGIVAVLYSGAFTSAIEICRKIQSTHPYFMFALSPICFALGAWLVNRFAPAAGGTGIPRVIMTLGMDPQLQREEIGNNLSLRVGLVVIASSVLCVLGGGALGREGPMVHIAACVFYVVGRWLHSFFPSDEHRSWIIAGGAAGVAAAFNAPLAGVVFVLEELAQQHFHKFKTQVITAAIIGGMMAQWLTGRYLFFGYPRVGEVPFSAVFWALVLGIVCGCLAVPFHWMLTPSFQKYYAKYFRSKLQFSIFAGILVAAMAVFIHPDSIGGGVGVIQNLLFDGPPATWSLIVVRFLGTIISHLSGCAGGFLAPSLALGAAIGSKFAVLTDYPNHNLLVMVGMSAFLSAIVRAPFTAWVIVMEMTDRHSTVFSLMVASLVSSGTVSFLQGWWRRRHDAHVVRRQAKLGTPPSDPPPSSSPPVV